MYNYGMMGYGGGWVFGGLIYVLIVVFLVLAIAALWKYVNKK